MEIEQLTCKHTEVDKVNFQEKIPFQTPPRSFRGMLIIEIDDGRKLDLTGWYPLLKTKKQKTQWYPFLYPVIANSAVNTDSIGASDKMTVEDLLFLENEGWEILNHGAKHAGLAVHRIGEDYKAGSLTLKVSLAHSLVKDYEYKIGVTGEIISIADIINIDDETKIGDIVLENPLNNDYQYSQAVELTDEDMEYEINGSLDKLLSWGLDVKHYVNPFHYWYATTRGKISERHLTSRSAEENWTNPLPITDAYRLHGVLDGLFRESDIAPFIDQIHDEDSIAIWYGHGYLYEKGSVLDKLIDYAVKKGVKIVTRDEAYQTKILSNS